MTSYQQITDTLQKCELCEQKMNPAVNIYNNNTRLCIGCFENMGNTPEVVANCMERFLIGNVV
jgi:hypothetical protein